MATLFNNHSYICIREAHHAGQSALNLLPLCRDGCWIMWPCYRVHITVWHSLFDLWLLLLSWFAIVCILISIVASVPTPSFSPQGDGLLSWHWIVIVVSIVVAIFLTFANIIGVILHGIFACKKPNKAAAIEKEMGMINISTDSTDLLKNDSV